MDFKIEISKITKIAFIATILGILLAWIFKKELMPFVPLVVLFVLMFSYPGTEKIGTKGFAQYAQAGFAVVAITLAILVIKMI